MMDTDTKFLQKIAEFTNLAIGEIEDLKEDLEYTRKKLAKETEVKLAKTAEFDKQLNKTADALYNSDFITDETERRRFLKSAKEDPGFLARTLEKVCKAADVSLIGIPARVAIKSKTAGEEDPVLDALIGRSSDSTSIFEDQT